MPGLACDVSVVGSRVGTCFGVLVCWVDVDRCLIERAQTMNQVVGVVAHEIGHVTLRHTVQQMQQSQEVNGGLMALCTLTKVCNSGTAQLGINLAGSALFASFSRQDEAQADDEGVKTSVKAGIDPHGVPEMFRILLNERKTNPSAVDAWFATHPGDEDRITATTKQIAAYPPNQLRNLQVAADAFQRAKRRLLSLPPSQTPKPVK